MTGTTALPCHLITPVSPDQKTLMPTKAITVESHCLGHNDLNKICELQVTVTGHPQVTVTLVWVNNPTLLGFLTKNLAFTWFNRLNSRPIGLCMVMTTLHTSSIPPLELQMLCLPGRRGTHHCFSCYHLLIHTYLSQQL